MIVENELKKLQKFDGSYFRERNYFSDDGTQNYLVFQPVKKYFKKIGYTESISSWESKGLSDEIIKPPNTFDNSLASKLEHFINKIKVKFNGSCIKQDKVKYNHGKVVNMYIIYKLSSKINNFDFASED